MRLPEPRGPISTRLIDTITGPPRDTTILAEAPVSDQPFFDEDLQLALFVCYELHYRGWDGVDDGWEWQPSLLAARRLLEQPFESALRAQFDPRQRGESVDPDTVPAALSRLIADDDGPALSSYAQRNATIEQFEEFAIHRSIYQLREADPHTWGIPRVGGAVKAALVEIQIDEYGGGQVDRMHAELFRTTMDRLGLDTRNGGYLDVVPAVTLAANNLMSLFGLHRRLRGALFGHLAVFEMTSSLPNRRYGNGLRRLGADEVTTRFYDEHVVADAVHEQIAANDLCGTFARTEPEHAADVLFGAAACLHLDNLLAERLLAAWEAGTSSLRQPDRQPVGAR